MPEMLPLLHTVTLKWREPASTNPKGWLAADVQLHPRGGLMARDDTAGQGLAVNVLGSPLARDWPEGVAVVGMPLKVNALSEVWAPPYPAVKHTTKTASGYVAGGPSGTANQLTVVSAAASVTLKNESAYPMMLMRRVLVRDARIINAQKAVTYALIVNGLTAAPWTLFSYVPDVKGNLAETHEVVVISTVNHTVVNSVALVDQVLPSAQAFSGAVNLPLITLPVGEEHELTAATAILYQDVTPAFEMQVGETHLEIIGWSVADAAYGQEE